MNLDGYSVISLFDLDYEGLESIGTVVVESDVDADFDGRMQYLAYKRTDEIEMILKLKGITNVDRCEEFSSLNTDGARIVCPLTRELWDQYMKGRGLR